MALKTKRITLQPKIVVDENGKEKEAKNRDTGKVFEITEMPIRQIDQWANRVLSSATRGGLDVKGLDFSAGFDTSTLGGILQLAQLAIQGFGNIAPQVSQDLLDELVDNTVKIVQSNGSTRPIDFNSEDLEEISSLWALRKEAFMLHVECFTGDVS